MFPHLAPAHGPPRKRPTEARPCSTARLRSGAMRASAGGFTILYAEGALALQLPQLRHQIPLALSCHRACDVIAEHSSTVARRRLSLNTFSST
jgi:hypothetical protein